MLASRATLGGILTLIAGAILRLYVADEGDLTPYLFLLSVAGLLWFIGVGFALAVDEESGATGGARNPLEEARAGWQLLQRQTGFRRFILARALLLSVRLSVPFYVLYARDLTGGALSGLGVFVIAVGLAEVVSSPFWGRFSDRSSRSVMIAGGLLAAGVAVLALSLGLLPAAWQTSLLFSVVFFLVGIARAGVRLGRKTYLVDGAPKKERPLYVALMNTVIGVITLAAGALGLVAEWFGVVTLLVLFLLLTLAGVIVTWRLPEAEALATS